MTEEVQGKIVACLRAGADMTLAAAAVGVGRRTIYDLMTRDDSFRELVRNAKDFADEMVVRSLFQRATGGNVLACIFWLKNRRPDEWRDRHTFEHSVNNLRKTEFKAVFDDGEDFDAPEPKALPEAASS